MRELIQDLARRATVILSTHILQEVQAICDRVIIINRAMTMRMWSEERRAGTFEFLMTTPGRCLWCSANFSPVSR
jgi:ABC-type multidrug transport system ATPase subunit